MFAIKYVNPYIGMIHKFLYYVAYCNSILIIHYYISFFEKLGYKFQKLLFSLLVRFSKF